MPARYAAWKSEHKGKKKNERPSRLAQPLVALLYSGKSVKFEPPRWDQHYPLPDSLRHLGVRFPIIGVNLTRMYREGRLVGSPFVRAMGELLAATSLKELPDVYKQIFASYNAVETWGEREQYLAKSSFAYADKALKNLGRPFTREDVLDINANLRKKKARDAMISYFDELELKGEIKDRIETICDLVDNKFSFCPQELSDKCRLINNVAILKSVWNYALCKAKTLEELMDFVDAQTDKR